MQSTAQSDALLVAGNAPAAVALIRQAAESGDVDALFRLAVWHLAGTPLSRDLPAARLFLRRAVAIGHVDAALMEIALMANGSGAPADLPTARKLLEIAARNDPVAADQHALLQQMERQPDKAAPEILSTRPDVQVFHALFTAAECLHVIRAAEHLLEPASVVDPKTGRHIPHPIRTSDSAVVGPAREDLVIRALNARIAAATDTAIDQGEPLAVLRYAPGQEYRPHHDALPGAANQRIWTMLVYLNEGYRGGATRFAESGLTFQGRKGDALLFRNVDPSGAIDRTARHQGMPVTAGQKWLCTRWIRARPYDPWQASPA